MTRDDFEELWNKVKHKGSGDTEVVIESKDGVIDAEATDALYIPPCAPSPNGVIRIVVSSVDD